MLRGHFVWVSSTAKSWYMLFKGLSFLSFVILSSKRILIVNRLHSEINFKSLLYWIIEMEVESRDNFFAYFFLTHPTNHSKDDIKSYEQKVKKPSMYLTWIFHSLALCPMPIAPTNGRIQGKDFRHGQSIKFWCFRGYTRVGASSATCNKGKWDRPFSVCKGQNCYLVLAITVNSAIQYIEHK